MPHPDTSTEAFHEALPDDFTTLGITRFTQRVAVENPKKARKAFSAASKISKVNFNILKYQKVPCK